MLFWRCGSGFSRTIDHFQKNKKKNRLTERIKKMKVYKKPEVRFENFTLSENIALSCSWVKDGDKYVNEDFGISLFAEGCDFSEGQFEGYCITNATNLIGNYTFNS